MNPADVAQSVLPLSSSDLSLLTLFWHAHWIVKAVMIGLLVCSVWVWAIVIDKTFLYARTKRAMDNFEASFWSGQSLENSTARCPRARAIRWQRCSSPRCGSGSAALKVRRALSPDFKPALKR